MFSTGLFDDRGDRWAAVAARTVSGAASLRVTATYALMLLAVSLTLTAMGPHARAAAVSRMSTNLHNLARGHVGTLVASAFVNESDDVLFWLPGLVCLLALGEIFWRGKGLIIAFAVGHIGATLIVAVGLVAAVETGSLPSSVARASDVGMSYGAACVLGALTASIPARWRPTWVGWWVGIALPPTWAADFTAVGHMLALLLGIGLSFRLRSTTRWTPLHVALLVVGVAFGFLVLSAQTLVAPLWGSAGALVAYLVGRVAVSSEPHRADAIADRRRRAGEAGPSAGLPGQSGGHSGMSGTPRQSLALPSRRPRRGVALRRWKPVSDPARSRGDVTF